MGIVVTLVALALHAGIVSGHAVASYQLQQYDSLRVARCVAHCWREPADQKETCESTCLQSQYLKPGTCPDSADLSVFDVACIKACSGDPDCSGTLKCCSHSCGITCQRAQGLDTVQGLLPVPVNLTVWERRHGRTVQLDWAEPGRPAPEADTTDAPDAAGLVLLYLLEERHHVGRYLTPERFGPWVTRHRSTRTSATLKNVLRPGRWYEFRVAAVNANGSRGFSKPSEPFKLSLAPKAPGLPQNLSVGALSTYNSTLRGVLTWQPPVSDLPIQRYKVFWSRRLEGPPTTQVSVLVHHQTVPGEVLRFALKGLESDSLYFLQVQAMSQFGRDRLKSEKAAIFLNTSDHKKVNEVTTPQTTTVNHRSARGADELQVQRIFWSQDQLMARLIWQPPYRTGVFYTVSWQVGSCQNGVPVARKSLLTGTTNIPEFDVHGLNFNCKYLVTVREVTSDNTIDPYKTVFQFITPSCKTFIRRNHHEKIPCSSSDSTSK